MMNRRLVSNIVAEITRKRIMWAEHFSRKDCSFIRVVVKENSMGKRSLGKPRLRQEDRIKKYIKAVELNVQ